MNRHWDTLLIQNVMDSPVDVLGFPQPARASVAGPAPFAALPLKRSTGIVLQVGHHSFGRLRAADDEMDVGAANVCRAQQPTLDRARLAHRLKDGRPRTLVQYVAGRRHAVRLGEFTMPVGLDQARTGDIVSPINRPGGATVQMCSIAGEGDEVGDRASDRLAPPRDVSQPARL